MTKHFCLIAIAICSLLLPATASAADVFQLPNSGFESWASSTRPNNWNTYETAEGSFSNIAKNSDQCERSTDKHSGSYSAVGKVKKLFGIPANGIITTGCISAGATSATDESNHNYSKISDASKSCAFTGRPDSCVAWIKNQPKSSSQCGRFYVLLHGKYETQDPGTNWSQVCAVAGTNPPQCGWTRYSVPFYYKGETLTIQNHNGVKSLSPACGDVRPSYALASFSTNYVPGEGDGSDKIYVDDVEMIYNSKLNSLTIDGTSVDNFSKNNFSYTVKKYYKDVKVAYKSDGKFATTTESYDEQTGVLTIKVMGDDYSANANSFHEYKMQFLRPAYIYSFKIGEAELTGFSAETFTYTINTMAYSAVKDKIAYSVANAASEPSENFNATTNVLTISFKNDAGEDVVYTFQFHAPFGSQLSSLQIAGAAVDGFSPAVYKYTVKNTYKETELAYEADAEATVATSFNPETYLLTITVNGGDIASNPTNTHTYEIQYHESYGSYLTALSVNGTSVSDFSSTKYAYSVKDVYTEDATAVTYTASAEAKVSTKFDAASLTCTLTVNGGDIASDPSNTHTYTIQFHAAYGSQLTTLKVNRIEVADFDPTKTEYNIVQSYASVTLSYEADEEASVVESAFDEATNTLKLTVSGGDIASNPSNTHTYTLRFCAPSFLTALSFDGSSVSSFRQTKYAYDLSSSTYEKSKVAYTASAGATTTADYNAETSVLTITVNGADLDIFPNNKHTYTIQFHTSYGSFLTELTLDGTLIENFAKTTYDYLVQSAYADHKVDYKQDADARVKSSFDDEANLLTITVSGADVAENPTNTHTYKVQFYAPSHLSVLKANGLSVPDFSPKTFEYDLSSYVYGETRITYYGENGATIDTTFADATNTLTITVSGSDVATYPENKNVYTLRFGSAQESYLTSLKINDVDVDGFQKNLFFYNSESVLYADATVDYTLSDGATATAQYDASNFQLTITVLGGNIADKPSNKHQYVIQFKDPTIYNSQLTELKVNGVLLSDFSKDNYNYFVDGSYSSMKPTYTADAKATVAEQFDREANTVILTVSGGNIAKEPTNYHIYKIQYSSSFAYEAFVTSLKVNGTAVEGFSAETFKGVSVSADYATAQVEIEVSPLANYCTDYSKGVLTIVVWAGDFDTNSKNFNTYKVTFKK